MPIVKRGAIINNSRSCTPLLICLIFLLCGSGWAEHWIASGPNGGDVRCLAYDPRNPDHILLGTSSGTIFHSLDAGHSWTHLAHLGSNDYVIDHIIIDPLNSKLIYVGAWSLREHHGGDLFRSRDGGNTWVAIAALHKMSIRAVAVAASDPNILIVGTLDGVFRSKDGGQKWGKISGGYPKITNVESIAIDRDNPDVIFAGTWHLAWKTTDRGTTWHSVRNGIIDDSDVFSIIVDQSNPNTVFASACSGIYKSADGGRTFERVQEIPFSARRTRVLKQDPNNPATIYAGTTEGLWVTRDSGTTWKRMTSHDLVINDVLVDPRNSRVLLATDRAGVLASDNAVLNFVGSNTGFAHRYISAILPDHKDRDVLYAGVMNDREFGGMFVSKDAGWHWIQKSEGLEGSDVFVLKQLHDGRILAGTNHGLYVLPPDGSEWNRLSDVQDEAQPNPQAPWGKETLSSAVKINDIEVTPNRWLAATASGLYFSFDEGKSWSRDNVIGSQYVVSARVQRNMIVVATTRMVMVSVGHVGKWRSSRLPSHVSRIRNLAITPDDQIIVATYQGAFRGPKFGTRWQRMPIGHGVNYVVYDDYNQRLLAVGSQSTAILESKDGGQSWHRASDTGYQLRQLSLVHGRVIAATLFDGVVLQPDTLR